MVEFCRRFGIASVELIHDAKTGAKAAQRARQVDNHRHGAVGEAFDRARSASIEGVHAVASSLGLWSSEVQPQSTELPTELAGDVEAVRMKQGKLKKPVAAQQRSRLNSGKLQRAETSRASIETTAQVGRHELMRIQKKQEQNLAHFNSHQFEITKQLAVARHCDPALIARCTTTEDLTGLIKTGAVPQSVLDREAAASRNQHAKTSEQVTVAEQRVPVATEQVVKFSLIDDEKLGQFCFGPKAAQDRKIKMDYRIDREPLATGDYVEVFSLCLIA